MPPSVYYTLSSGRCKPEFQERGYASSLSYVPRTLNVTFYVQLLCLDLTKVQGSEPLGRSSEL